MKIQLVTFDGCPHADLARANLREALRFEKIDAAIEEIDIQKPEAIASLGAWGSPTILIDGADLFGAQPRQGGVGCRLYADGAPSVDQIRARLRRP